ncbi:hypothetical protein [Psychromicrobium sp. YIM B11713]|uniref:hypothetical protein n=1 Tax=Psychromicrobium sp. YIM B11713 TaxID=3145233 RepID=UPI00374E9E3F
MPQNPALTAQLDTVEGNKTLFGGGLFGGRAKKAQALFAQATSKGVAPAALLAERDYGDNNLYYALAFSTGEDIDLPTLEKLRGEAEAIADGLRDHGYLYDVPVAWDGGGKIWIKDRPAFRNLSDPSRGIYVIPLQLLAGESWPRHIAWGIVGGGLQVAAVYHS